MVTLDQVGQALGSRFLPALKFRDYRQLWYATMCSQGAAWALIVARGALAKTEGSDMWVGLVTFSAMIPSVLMSPVAGFLADRFDRRSVLACAYTVNLSHNILLAILVITGSIEVWHLVVLSLLNGSARATQMPSAQALLANMVPRERLFNAVALYQATQQGSRFTGPMLILLMLWITGPFIAENQDWIFILPVALYATGLVLVLSIHTRSRGVVESGKGASVVVRNVSAGLNYMYHNRLVLSIVLLVVAHCGMTMSFESLFPAISTEKLGMEPGAGILTGFGYLMVAYGGAGLLMSMSLAGVQTDHTRGRLLLWLGVSSGVTPVALALTPNLPIAMLAVVGMGASASGFMTISQGMVQSIAPDAIRGRMMGVYSWHIQGFMASFNLINGTLAAVTMFTAPLILAAGGIGFLWVMGASFVRVPLRSLYASGVPASARTF